MKKKYKISWDKQQSSLPLALPEGWELVFLLSLLKRTEKRKEKKRKERNKNHMSVMFFNYLHEYCEYLLLLWQASTIMVKTEVFVTLMLSSNLLVTSTLVPTGRGHLY